LLVLPAEMGRIDALLDDEAFFVPFVPFFDPRIGRPSTPMETYLRLMFLKFRTGSDMSRCAGRWVCPCRQPSRSESDTSGECPPCRW
jgi:hypothetical protein